MGGGIDTWICGFGLWVDGCDCVSVNCMTSCLSSAISFRNFCFVGDGFLRCRRSCFRLGDWTGSSTDDFGDAGLFRRCCFRVD